MRYILMFVVALLCNNLVAQEKTKLQFYLSPIGFRIGNSHVEEFGEGTYDFHSYNKNNFEAGLLFGKMLFDHVYFDVGLGIRMVKYDFMYTISDPFQPDQVLYTQERYHNIFMLSPHIGITYKMNKFSCSIGFEPNLELWAKSNIDYYAGPIEFYFDPSNHKSAYYTVIERTAFMKSFTHFATPTVALEYTLGSKFSIRLSGLIKPYGEYFLYQLEIKGKTAEMPENSFAVLSDTRVNNKMLFAYIGFSYSITSKKTIE